MPGTVPRAAPRPYAEPAGPAVPARRPEPALRSGHRRDRRGGGARLRGDRHVDADHRAVHARPALRAADPARPGRRSSAGRPRRGESPGGRHTGGVTPPRARTGPATTSPGRRSRASREVPDRPAAARHGTRPDPGAGRRPGRRRSPAGPPAIAPVDRGPVGGPVVQEPVAPGSPHPSRPGQGHPRSASARRRRRVRRRRVRRWRPRRARRAGPAATGRGTRHRAPTDGSPAVVAVTPRRPSSYLPARVRPVYRSLGLPEPLVPVRVPPPLRATAT